MHPQHERVVPQQRMDHLRPQVPPAYLPWPRVSPGARSDHLSLGAVGAPWRRLTRSGRDGSARPVGLELLLDGRDRRRIRYDEADLAVGVDRVRRHVLGADERPVVGDDQLRMTIERFNVLYMYLRGGRGTMYSRSDRRIAQRLAQVGARAEAEARLIRIPSHHERRTRGSSAKVGARAAAGCSRRTSAPRPRHCTTSINLEGGDANVIWVEPAARAPALRERIPGPVALVSRPAASPQHHRVPRPPPAGSASASVTPRSEVARGAPWT